MTDHSPASIRWVSLFVGSHISILPPAEGPFFGSPEEVRKMDELLTQLPHLDKVVLETADVKDSAKLASLLPNVADKVHRWSSQDAEKYAKGARTRGVPSRNCLPISPSRYATVFSCILIRLVEPCLLGGRKP